MDAISRGNYPEELLRKLEILTDAAKYDAACTSSGVNRRGNGMMGNAVQSGICHSFAGDGRCISLLKILLTNECIFDCRYCVNRRSNDRERVRFTPEEICTLTVEFYKRNYIEGLFLSSGVWQSPDATMEEIYQTVYLLRNKYHFGGYIHVKAIPGADPTLVELTGWLADRMSVNLEFPTAKGLQLLAPGKTRKTILTPMYRIQQGREAQNRLSTYGVALRQENALIPGRRKAVFVPGGQSTQMIVGATSETDYEIITVAESLYGQYELKRVFYSAFVRVNDDPLFPPQNMPPTRREHRLYQADWLMRFYGFRSEELLSPEDPSLDLELDPKCIWALKHPEVFPVEVGTAPYGMLLRVPGIGVKNARRIVLARRTARLSFEDLKKMGIALKRAMYFLTCQGKYYRHFPDRMEFVRANLLCLPGESPQGPSEEAMYEQLSLFSPKEVAS